MLRWILASILVVTLSACSGGSSSSADATSGEDAATDVTGGDSTVVDKDGGVEADGLSSCGISGYQEVDLTTLLNEMDSYDGLKIVVCAKGTLSIACTGIACEPSNPCCGGCGGGLQLGSTISLAPADGSAPYVCSGDGCMGGMSCTPWPQSEMENPRCYFGTFSEYPVGLTGKLLVDHALDLCLP
ncbi:MAG: hypothetical protein KC609_18105 [Myxococcales bacterium]|nr:hypothetical protein [Myxococcales bacterium]